MTHIALKNFPLSRDGVNIEDIIKGEPVEVPESLVGGLLDAGYIALPDAVPVIEGTESDGTGEPNPNGEPIVSEGSGDGTESDGTESDGEKTDASEAKAAAKKSSAAKKDGAE